MGFCVCCPGKNTAGKVHRIGAGIKKADFKPYISGQSEKGHHRQKTAEISEKKGYDIRDYDTRTLTPFMDHMIVASTANTRQNNAICQNIKDRLKEAGIALPMRIEGDSDSRWILIDLQDVVVHLFVQQEREVYRLDRLYADVPVEVYDL